MSFTPINSPGCNFRCIWGNNRKREVDVTGFKTLQNSGLRPFVVLLDQSDEDTASTSTDDTISPIPSISSTPSSSPIFFPSPKTWPSSKDVLAKDPPKRLANPLLRSKTKNKNGVNRVSKREHWSVTRRKRRTSHEHNSKLWISWFNNHILRPQIERDRQVEKGPSTDKGGQKNRDDPAAAGDVETE